MVGRFLRQLESATEGDIHEDYVQAVEDLEAIKSSLPQDEHP